MESLPDDVLQDILEKCPDYATLSTATLLCKRLHSTAEQHPKSIAKAIARNLIGDALPQAMRVARYRKMINDFGVDPHDEEQVVILAEFDMNAVLDTDEVEVLSTQDMKILTRLSGCLKTLEDAFSWRHRDRRSHTSVLSDLESLRFRKALLRLILFCAIFSPRHLDDVYTRFQHEEELEIFGMGAGNGPVALVNYHKATKRFFASFLSQDLLEMLPVANFLIDLGGWLVVSRGPLLTLRLLCGPLTIASQFRSQMASSCHYADMTRWLSVEGVWGSMYATAVNATLSENSDTGNTFLTGVLIFTLKQRQEVNVPAERTGMHTLQGLDFILDPVDAAPEYCAHCQDSDTLLWNCDNWDFVNGSNDLSLTPLSQHLPGNLSSVHSVTEDVRSQYEALRSANPRWVHALMLDLFNKDFIQAEWEGLCAEDLLCNVCLQDFVGQHLYLWLREKRALRGDPVLDDCRWGYSCTTMVFNETHAAELNHLCPQSRQT
ncbi:hypothetical protein CYLTODRAFT_493864 [Cylindrobasidium torrendii FP15055 ss-10]|uniref:F-box domain-containing protein n=1 Tax=Cylindrobasidium torrendii FP15055 ss-10 TaxID=1314674 RepID=A0A0D7AYQ3_9AGAR|nr:hypothetical protein CYLTODRAFT_493864 [Cylindrobasidium torrendii FP15055 ss-10]